MKKNYWKAGDRLTKLLSCKILKHMRNTLLLLIITVFHSYATTSYSQTALLSLDVKDVTVGSVLEKIEEQSDFYFLFNAKLVDIDRRVSVSANNQKIFPILDQIFNKTNVEYIVYNQQIVLSPGDYIAGMKKQALQPRDITGTVTDENGNPVIGATVIVKGTTQGTISDTKGKFSLANVPEDGVLVFSFVGMRTQEIVVGNQTIINVSMEEETIGLDEVVVIGYGTVKKSDLTGAVASVTSEELSAFPTGDVAKSLQGRAAGVHIQARDGEPGTSSIIQIRGATSINAGSDPIFVVDGFVGGILPAPEAIESIEILKDASATAIYGSRGANGVIIVTTKMGKPGQTIVEFNSSVSLQKDINRLNLVTSELYHEAF